MVSISENKPKEKYHWVENQPYKFLGVLVGFLGFFAEYIIQGWLLISGSLGHGLLVTVVRDTVRFWTCKKSLMFEDEQSGPGRTKDLS